MTITKIISSGTSGAESAALDVAIHLKIPHGGYTMEGTMLDKYRVTRRYKLMGKGFADSRAKDEANLHIADATLSEDEASAVILARLAWELTGTKTGRTRAVEMSNQLYGELRALYRQRQKEALKTGSNEVEPIIFHTKGDYTSQNSVRNVWKRLLEKSGLD